MGGGGGGGSCAIKRNFGENSPCSHNNNSASFLTWRVKNGFPLPTGLTVSSKGLDIIRPPGVRTPGYSPSKLSYGKGGSTPPAPSYGGGGPTPPASFRHHIIKMSSLVKSIVRGVFYPLTPAELWFCPRVGASIYAYCIELLQITISILPEG